MAATILAAGLSVLAFLLGAAIVGAVKWAAAINRATQAATGTVAQLAERIGELATDVRELAVSSQDVALVRAELAAHVRLADERWSMLGGFIPHPRYTGAEGRRSRREPAAEVV